MIFALAFYFCAAVILISGFLVVISRNPVHSVLWLILTFLSAVGLFVLLNAEFLAMLLMIVYVGAVAVLFLFVVMMLDVDFASLREGTMKNLGFGILLAIVFAVELLLVARAAGTSQIEAQIPITDAENTYQLGIALYTQYPFVFLGSGLVLLVAMIGAIVLTMSHRSDIKRQDVLAQMYRDPKKAMELKDVKPGKGI